MKDVDLGFFEECEPWQVESYQFPSKAGGKPAWLNLKDLPKPDQLSCSACNQIMVYLCQIYAPIEEDDANFHRTVFVFICRNSSCCERNQNHNLAVVRCSLSRRNEFYSYDPPSEEKLCDFSVAKWSKVCELCGCLAEKSCGQCKKVNYCCREHQVADWKAHKVQCKDLDSKNKSETSSLLFNEWEIVIEPDSAIEVKSNLDLEEEELLKYEQLAKEGKTGLSDLSECELESHACVDEDKYFSKFRSKLKSNPNQVIRYNKASEPLWIAESPLPESIPACQYCGSARQFEFQIMPQMLYLLKEQELDWGVLAIYTCAKSCVEGQAYKSEFIFKQDCKLQ